MSLLREIQEASVDSKTSLLDVLRKCAILAARLDNQSFKVWVHYELNGYPEDVEPPMYRIQKAPAKGHFNRPFGGGYRSLGIPPSALPEKYRQFSEVIHVKQTIAECIAIAETNPSGEITCPWPADLVSLLGQEIFKDMQCYGAWQEASHGAFSGIVDAVRTRILEFVLQIELEAPGAIEPGDVSWPLSDARLNDLHRIIIINGNVANLAASSPGAVQHSVTVSLGNIDSLKKALADLGVPTSEASELEEALAQDGKSDGIGPRTAAWIARHIQKSAIAVGSGTATSVVVKLICEFLGIG